MSNRETQDRNTQPGADEKAPGVHKPETTPAEERGERIDTGKSIARGGKTEGPVPGADEKRVTE